MGVYRVDSPAAAQMRAIRRMEEKGRLKKQEADKEGRRRWKEDLRRSSKEASAASKAADRELRLDELWREVKARQGPQGKGTIAKFLWHGELPEGGPIQPQPDPNVKVTPKKVKPLTVEGAYNIAMKGEPIPYDGADPNETTMQKQLAQVPSRQDPAAMLQQQLEQDLPGLPDVPTGGGRQFMQQAIPGAGPAGPGGAGQPGATAMGGPLPYGQPMEGGGYDITAAAQTMLGRMPENPRPMGEVPLQHLFKQISALSGGKGGGKSKMDDLTGFAQALDLMGMGKPTREELASIFGAAKSGTGIGTPPGGVEGEGETTTRKSARKEKGGPSSAFQTSRQHVSSLADITKDPVLVDKITRALSQYGLSFADIQIDKDGPYVTHPSGRKMRFTQVEGVR